MIDIVITWVDGNDPEWITEYKKYNKNFDTDANHAARFRDWDTLRYVFRGIEKFMPWVNRIHLVTMNQKPKWLNINHPKVNLVSHRDIFKNKKHLPTFNSSAIEMNFLGIDNLAKKFILFNDDTMVLKNVRDDDFFRNDLPRDFLIQNIFKDIMTPQLFKDNTWVNNISKSMEIINDKFDKKAGDEFDNYSYGFMNDVKNKVANLFNKYYLFEHYHHPQPYLKSVWEQVIKENENVINKTSLSKFRARDNVTQYLVRAYQLVSGQFIPKYDKNFETINIKTIKDAKKCSKLIKGNTFLCINDDPSLTNEDYHIAKGIVIDELDVIMQEKSQFEK